MKFYQPEMDQKVGTLIGGVIGFFKINLLALAAVFNSPEWELITNAAIGATIGFIVTTFLRFIFEKIKTKWSKK